MSVATIHTSHEPQRPAGALTVTSNQADWSQDQKAALAAIGVDKAPQADQRVFLTVCQRTGLDPFARQIYMIKRRQWNPDIQAKEDRWTIQTAIDGFRIIAERSGRYAGQTEPEWCGEDGVWRNVWTSKTRPSAARVGVYKTGFAAPLYAVAHMGEYDGGNRMWKDKPAVMLSKCAESLALRKAFPQDLTGLYTSDEMHQASSREDAAPAAVATAAPPAQQQPQRQDTGAKGQVIDAAPAEQPQQEVSEQARREQSEQALAEFDWTEAITLAAGNEDPNAALEDLRALWHSAKECGAGNDVATKLREVMKSVAERAEEYNAENAQQQAVDDARDEAAAEA